MKELTYANAYREAVLVELENDASVFIAAQDIIKGGIFGVYNGLHEMFPKRIVPMPISETAMIGLGVGAAIAGLRPIIEINFADFTFTCMDEIMNQAAKMHFVSGGQLKVPLVIVINHGGGKSLAAQHSQNIEAIFAHVPGLKVAIPSSPYDVKGLMITAIRDDNPVVFINDSKLMSVKSEVPEELYSLPFGKGVIKREGTDITIVSWSAMLQRCLKASAKLAEEGISVEVIDPRTLIPLDKDIINKSVQKTGRLLIVHEAVKTCGYGAEIAAMVAEEAFEYLRAPICRLGSLYSPAPYSQPLENEYIPSEEKIKDSVKRLL